MDRSRNKKLVSAAVIVMSSIVVSRITGFFREMLVPNAFGMAKTADAYVIAFKVTGLMYDMLVGGAIAAALIPILSGYIEKNQEKDGWKAVGTFINVIFAAMTVTCIMGIIFAPKIVPIFAVGFDEATIILTVKLIRILFPSVAFLMLAGLSNGILNSYKRFAAAAYGPTIYNTGSIISILVFSRIGIETVAYGVMGSSIIYFLFQLSFAAKNLKYYRFRFYLKHPGFVRIFKLAIPSLISSSIVQVNVLISSSFASLFIAGSVTAFNMADRVWQLPYGVFAQGIGIALLPTLSGRYVTGDMDDFKNILTRGLKTVLLFSIPSAFAFVVLKEDVIRTILKFTKMISEDDVALTGTILMFFSIALITHSIVTIMNRAFYSVNDTRTPLYIGSTTIVLNISLSYLFYRTTSLNVGGMALAYSLASMTNSVLLLTFFNRKIKGINIKKFIIFMIKAIISASVMAVILYLLGMFVSSSNVSKAVQIINLLIKVIIGAVVYFVSVLILKIDEGIYIYRTIIEKAKRIIGKILKE